MKALRAERGHGEATGAELKLELDKDSPERTATEFPTP